MTRSVDAEQEGVPRSETVTFNPKYAGLHIGESVTVSTRLSARYKKPWLLTAKYCVPLPVELNVIIEFSPVSKSVALSATRSVFILVDAGTTRCEF